MTYPTTSKVINYDYDGFSRVTAISTGTTEVENYAYLGVGTVVKRGHSGPGVDMSYIELLGESTGDAGDQYTGLDRFGRVVDQRWLKTSDGSNIDRYQYTYDRDSNRLTRNNLVSSSFNETYSYDNLNQLSTFAVTGTSKSWDYDAVGNWDGVTTNSTTESRGHNKRNEITSATGQTTPTYDYHGNETKDFAGLNYTYDA